MRLLSTALLTLATAVAPAQAAEFAFEDVLAQLETLMDLGRWGQAKRQLLAELERRAGEVGVVAHLVEVQEILLRCSFGAAHGPKQPAEVVAGELLDYEPGRGEIHLRYRPREDSAPADFFESGPDEEFWLHPLEWNGPFSIRLSGSSLDETVGVIACTDGTSVYVVLADSYLGLVRGREGEEGEFVGEPIAIDASAPWLLEVRVDTHTLEVFFGGERLIATDKPDDLFGHCGLTSFAGIDSIELEGKAELSWIQSKIDDVNAWARIEYEKTYDPKADLPPWLRPFDLSVAPGEEPDPELELFAGFGDAPQGVIDRARTLVEKQDWSAGLEFADALSEEQVGPRLKAWMRGLFLLRLGRKPEALAALEASLAMDRGDLATRRAHAQLLWEERDHATALSVSQALIADFPDHPGPYEDLAGALLLDARKQDVVALLARAAAAGVRSGELQAIERVLVRARRGPAWSHVHEYSSRHYVVRSDISRELCLEAARELDGAHRMFEMRLGRIESQGDELLPVYLFSGQGTYLLYAREVSGALPVHTAGVYSPALQQLLIWNLPRRAEMLRTVRHEGFHQFLDRRVGSAPVWLNEGLAEYFSFSRLERGRWAHGDRVEHHLAALRRPGFEWTPLEELLRLEPEEFYAGKGDRYAEAWHWVHFLESSGVQNGRRMRTLVDALANGTGESDALEFAFPAGERAELDRERRAHLLEP